MVSVSRSKTTKDLLSLLVIFAVVYAAAWIGSTLAGPMPDAWYSSLQKPSFTPPNWLFGPVWGVLYAMMALAGWLLWRNRSRHGAKLALGFFAAQLFFNVIWSGLFFGLHRIDLAFLDLSLTWIATAATIIAALRVRRLAALLLLPYLAWLTYAGLLNAAFWQMNA